MTVKFKSTLNRLKFEKVHANDTTCYRCSLCKFNVGEKPWADMIHRHASNCPRKDDVVFKTNLLLDQLPQLPNVSQQKKTENGSLEPPLTTSKAVEYYIVECLMEKGMTAPQIFHVFECFKSVCNKVDGNILGLINNMHTSRKTIKRRVTEISKKNKDTTVTNIELKDNQSDVSNTISLPQINPVTANHLSNIGNVINPNNQS
ncbi:hypothetical protein QTN25_004312 [Entamoeba marina]